MFEAWSSGDPDAPRPFFTDDAVLSDTASGRFEGWPAIRAFFAKGLSRWGDLVLAPDEFWFSGPHEPPSVAVHYVMSGTVLDPATYGEQFVGRRWSVEVMSYLRFRDDQVHYEVDVHDRGGRARSLGLDSWIGDPPQPDPHRPVGTS